MRFLSLLWLASLVAGNVEKTIFVAPAAINLSQDGPGLETLCLKSLSTQSQETRLRLSLPVKFASHEYPAGETSWYLLQNLSPGQRYEVRICWAATVSSSFVTFWYSLIIRSNPQTSDSTHSPSMRSWIHQDWLQICPILLTLKMGFLASLNSQRLNSRPCSYG